VFNREGIPPVIAGWSSMKFTYSKIQGNWLPS
jgi:hypothetical protein